MIWRVYAVSVPLIVLWVSQNVQCMQTVSIPLQQEAQNIHLTSASLDAEKLYIAFSGAIGTKINELLSQRTCAQRIEIEKAFSNKYKTKLKDFISSNTSGSYQTLLLSLFNCKVSMYAFLLRKSFLGLGTDEKNLIETMILFSKQPENRDALIKEYRNLYGTSLYGDMQGETSGDLLNIMMELTLRSRRISGGTDTSLAIEIVDLLKNEMDYWQDSRVVLDTTVMESSMDQVKVIFAEFAKIVGSDLELILKNKLSGYSKTIYTNLVRFLKNELEFTVDCLFESLDGNNDISLIRIIVPASDSTIMETIKIRFQEKYGVTLHKKIQEETSDRNFKNLLLALVDGKSSAQTPVAHNKMSQHKPNPKKPTSSSESEGD